MSERVVLRKALGLDLSRREWRTLAAVLSVLDGQPAVRLDVEEVAVLVFDTDGSLEPWQRRKTMEAIRSLDGKGLISWSTKMGKPEFTSYGPPRSSIAVN